ncbi:MAG: EAL domain-containing protein [Nitrosomonadales bacterium]|nr:EAL domain-containing protein [Nitrosomonadales bacterium]
MPIHIRKRPLTLRQLFGRRLWLLLVIFSTGMSGIIALVYSHQTDKLNRAKMADALAHMIPRLEDQQHIWQENAQHVHSITEWSGILNTGETQRSEKLRAFFTAQAENLGFEGIVINEAGNNKTIFSYWNGNEAPDFQTALLDDQPFWFDAAHATLYTKISIPLQVINFHANMIFFKAWDNATLKRLNYPNTTSMLSLGNQPLLSSAGSLALSDAPPAGQFYSEARIGKHRYQEGRKLWAELHYPNGQHAPLYLNLRSPLEINFPVPLVLAVSTGITLLFGVLLFMTVGHWLRQMGSRLDSLADAALRYQNEPDRGISAEIKQSLQASIGGNTDQISVVTEELKNLMENATQRNAEQRAHLQTLDLLQDAVIEFSAEGKMLHATSAWNLLTGVDDIATCDITKCVHPDDVPAFLEQISALTYQQKDQVHIRFRLNRQDEPRAHFWVEGRFAAITQGENIVSYRGVVRDITHTYRQERQISHMAMHDALTDLPNRVLLEDRMGMALSRADRGAMRVALGFIDLDHFKQVNDNFGHKTGDAMLKEVTSRLLTILRGTDTLSRWGGDEFVVLCPDLKTLEDARDITHKLEALTSHNIEIDGTEFPFNFSAGFAVYPDDASSGEMLLAQADRAMFYAKAQGRNNIQFFNSIAAKEPGRQSFYIQSRLNQAVHANQIQCWLQPLVSAHTGKVIGAEALARWHVPDQGWIPPAVFIPMAESMGLIDKVGQLVWQQALHALTLLPPGHRLSVNLSKRQLFSSSIVEQLCDDVARANIATGQIMLEITESIALSDVSFARERIAELDSKGFGIAVDDFGVGYSSLSQLHEIPADELKLDISFVRRIHDKAGFGMATAIVAIAKSLELECVAEGVEDEATARLLDEMGVEILQGYLYAKPMPIDEYLAWLAARGEA